MARKALNPIVQAYMESQPEPFRLLEALRKIPGPRTKKEAAIFTLLEARVASAPLDFGPLLAEAVIDEPAQADVQILLISMIVRFSLRTKGFRTDEMMILLRRAKSLLNPASPILFQAGLATLEGELLVRKGDFVRGLQKMTEALEICPPDSPHRPSLMVPLAVRRLALGMGALVSEEISQVAKVETQFAAWLMVAQFINDAAVGNLEPAIHRLAEVQRMVDQAESHSLLKLGIEPAVHVIQVMKWEKNTRNTLHALTRLEMERSDPAWVVSTRYLARRQPEEALRWARAYTAQATEEEPVSKVFNEYTLIRAELSSGNADAARGLLLARQRQGARHYLDDFFLARLERLMGREKAAAQHFARLWKSIETYKAEGRLDFEIRLACELGPQDILRWAYAPAKPVSEPVVETPLASTQGLDKILSASPSMAEMRKMLAKLANLTAPVLVTGETGTGKELVAQALHEAGPRANRPFVSVNCGAVSEALIESELFGHMRGAFTGADQARQGLFEEAGEGTLFLDEIGEISPKLQVSLLRVLEKGEYRPVGSSRTRQIHCRVVAATNADLEQRVKSGSFRKDLFFRLNRLNVHLPPLRERPEDVAVLAAHFLDQGRTPGVHARMSPGLLDSLRKSPWPGNVRELKNAVERMRLLNSDKLEYTEQDFTSAFLMPSPVSDEQPPAKEAFEEEGVVWESRFPEAGRREEKILKEIYRLFQRYKKLRAYKITGMVGITPNTTTSYLRMLCTQGLIEKVQPTASPRSHYFALREGRQ